MSPSPLTLADVTTHIVDCPHKTAPASERGGIPQAGAKDIKNGRINFDGIKRVSEATYREWTERLEPEPYDILMTREAPVAEVAMVPPDTRLCLGQRTVLLRADRQRILPEYLLYLLQSSELQHDLKRRSEGSTVAHLNMGEIRALPLPQLPAIAQQQTVVDVLGPLDKLVASRSGAVDMLERTSRALFRAWFVEFDPARRPGAWPESVTAIYPDSFRESPLGPIPAGWNVRPVSEALEVNPGRRLQRGTLAPYVGLADISETSPRVPIWRHREYTSGSRFTNHDVLMARITPSLENGKVAYVDCLPADTVAWGSTEFIVLRSRSPLPSTYAYFVASDAQFRAHAVANMTGSSGRQRVPAGALDHYEIVIPDQPVADLFARFTEPVFRLARAYQNSATIAEQLRDTLLPKLISGELTVQEAEERVEEVA